MIIAFNGHAPKFGQQKSRAPAIGRCSAPSSQYWPEKGKRKAPWSKPRSHSISSITYYSGSSSTLQFRLPPILLIIFFSFALSNDSHVVSHLTLTCWFIFCFHPRLFRITALLVENHIRNYDTPKVGCQQADRRLDIPVECGS